MVEFKESDFVKVDFDLYANGKLVQTTSEKKGKEAGLQSEKFETATLILGKSFVLKALDEDILKGNTSGTLELTAEQAYGKRDKTLLKTVQRKVFDEQKLRAVVGMVYDFNGMYGTVKSVSANRVLVDFNNPLSGKEIKVEYKDVKLVEDLKEKIEFSLENVLRLPKTYFDIKVDGKKVDISAPKEVVAIKDMITNALKDTLGEDTVKDLEYSFSEKQLAKK